MELRQARGGLSAACLKYLACAFMLVHHLSFVWNPFIVQTPDGSFSLLSSLMYYLGRPAFPIFVFFVAEGCRKTRDIRRYLLRLGLFAALSQLPYSLYLRTWGGSVLLTFFLGVLGVFCYQRLRPRAPAAAAVLPALALALLAQVLACDYGWLGVLLTAALYLCGENRRRQLLCLGVVLAAAYLVEQPMGYLLGSWIPPGAPLLPALAQVLPAYLDLYLPYHLTVFASSCAALVLLGFYRGARGRGSKWFFYLFYPAHLLALWAAGLILSR